MIFTSITFTVMIWHLCVLCHQILILCIEKPEIVFHAFMPLWIQAKGMNITYGVCLGRNLSWVKIQPPFLNFSDPHQLYTVAGTNHKKPSWHGYSRGRTTWAWSSPSSGLPCLSLLQDDFSPPLSAPTQPSKHFTGQHRIGILHCWAGMCLFAMPGSSQVGINMPYNTFVTFWTSVGVATPAQVQFWIITKVWIVSSSMCQWTSKDIRC